MILRDSDSDVPAAETIYNQNQPFWWDAARIIEDDFTFPLYERAAVQKNRNKGKKKGTLSKDKNGYYIFSAPANKDYSDIAADATLRNAAWKQKARNKQQPKNNLAVQIIPADVMKKIRIRKTKSLIIFLVDLSWSMAVTQRLSATRNAILTILEKAYQYRDDICLITFHKESASMLISPTHSITIAERAMENIPIGGKTPLAAGLLLAKEVIQKERTNYGIENLHLILLSDCEGNISYPPESLSDPQEQAIAAAEQIALEGCRSIIINSDQMSFGEGYANNLARHMNASCYLISGLNADHLIKAVRSELIL